MANKDNLSFFAQLFSDGEFISSTRFVFVFGIIATFICGFTMCFLVLYKMSPDKEKAGYIAPILGAVFGGMVAIISTLSAIKGYITKQENQSPPKEDQQ